MHLFKYSSSSWTHVQRLLEPTSGDYREFGVQVAVTEYDDGSVRLVTGTCTSRVPNHCLGGGLLYESFSSDGIHFSVPANVSFAVHDSDSVTPSNRMSDLGHEQTQIGIHGDRMVCALGYSVALFAWNSSAASWIFEAELNNMDINDQSHHISSQPCTRSMC